jgi:protein phosphatase
MVADGMGGHAAGEIASGIAIKTASETYYGSDLDGAGDPTSALSHAFQEANRAILTEGSRHLECFGMGTTCSGIVLRGGEYWLCHVGDSRIYRFAEGRLDRLTRDHTLISQMIESGSIEPDDLSHMAIRHILVRAMGIEYTVELDVSDRPQRLNPGDKLLVCSDGLHGVLTDEKIAELLGRTGGQAAVNALIAAANSEGGPDNITAILVERSG